MVDEGTRGRNQQMSPLLYLREGSVLLSMLRVGGDHTGGWEARKQLPLRGDI